MQLFFFFAFLKKKKGNLLTRIVYMEQFQNGKDKLSMHQKSGKLPDCPEKRTAQKIYRVYTKGKKKSNNNFATMFAGRKMVRKTLCLPHV